MTAVREKSYRGISQRIAKHYLQGLGGETTEFGDIVGPDWSAKLRESTVHIGPTLTLTEVTVRFEGNPETLDEIVHRFDRKALRAGG